MSAEEQYRLQIYLHRLAPRVFCDKYFSRDAQFFLQDPYHRKTQGSLVIQYFRSPAFRSDDLRESRYIKTHLLQPKFDRFNRIRQIDGKRPALVFVNKYGKQFELGVFIAFRGEFFSINTAMRFKAALCSFVVLIAFIIKYLLRVNVLACSRSAGFTDVCG